MLRFLCVNAMRCPTDAKRCKRKGASGPKSIHLFVSLVKGVFSELFLRYSVRRIRGTLAPFFCGTLPYTEYPLLLFIKVSVDKDLLLGALQIDNLGAL